MTLPRRLLPGRTHALTRRVSERRLLLKPTPEVTQIVLYALGRAQELYPGVEVHAFLSHANHQHWVCTDTHAEGEVSELPLFMQVYGGLVGRALNAHWGRGENFWRGGSYDNVETFSDLSTEDQLLYLWTNVVKDGLLENPGDWPGAIFLPEDLGTEILVEKPSQAFFGGRRKARRSKAALGPEARRLAELAELEEEALKTHRLRLRDAKRKRSKRRRRQLGRERRRRGKRKKERATRLRPERSTLPQQVRVKIAVPPGYEDQPVEEVRKRFRALLDARLAELRAERGARERYKGVAAILAEDPRRSVGDTFPSFGRNPRVACKGLEARIDALLELQEWRRRYRAAWERYRAGDVDVVFPPGTYQVVRRHHARAQPP